MGLLLLRPLLLLPPPLPLPPPPPLLLLLLLPATLQAPPPTYTTPERIMVRVSMASHPFYEFGPKLLYLLTSKACSTAVYVC